jgi:hypothetical protein
VLSSATFHVRRVQRGLEVAQHLASRNDVSVGALPPFHNPSGVAEPSGAEELLTRTLVEVLKYIEVRVIDHIIVAGNNTCSTASAWLGVMRRACAPLFLPALLTTSVDDHPLKTPAVSPYIQNVPDASSTPLGGFRPSARAEGLFVCGSPVLPRFQPSLAAPRAHWATRGVAGLLFPGRCHARSSRQGLRTPYCL